MGFGPCSTYCSWSCIPWLSLCFRPFSWAHLEAVWRYGEDISFINLLLNWWYVWYVEVTWAPSYLSCAIDHCLHVRLQDCSAQGTEAQYTFKVCFASNLQKPQYVFLIFGSWNFNCNLAQRSWCESNSPTRIQQNWAAWKTEECARMCTLVHYWVWKDETMSCNKGVSETDHRNENGYCFSISGTCKTWNILLVPDFLLVWHDTIIFLHMSQSVRDCQFDEWNAVKSFGEELL